MSDIVSEIMSMASPKVVSALAASTGLDNAAVNSVLTGAVPGILGALVNRGATPSGGTAILGQLANVNPSIASGLTSVLGGDGANTLATQGTAMLTALVGRDGMSSLTNAVLGSAGVPPAAGGPLIGIASSMVMGALANKAAGLDGAGLSQLLATQKGAIQKALPSGIGQVLGMTGGAASGASTAAASAIRNTASQVQASAPDAPVSGMGYLKYVLPVAVIAIGAWYYMGHRNIADDNMPAKPAATATAPAPAATATPAMANSVMVGDVDVSKNLTTAFANITSTLNGVTDTASATAALPKLQDANNAIAAVSGVAAKFTPEQKAAVATMVNGATPALSGLATNVQGNPDVVAVLKPVLDTIMATLASLAK